jgi:hypothetical protein
MTTTTTDRDPPRAHHMQFKYAVVTHALEKPAELVTMDYALLWEAIGAGLPDDERIEPAGLDARNAGDAAHPVLMISLPQPERPNEAYYLCAVPANAQPDGNGGLNLPDPEDGLRLRIFGMERSVLPDGGLIGFVVEWTSLYRHNYDAPDDASQAAFWRAINEIIAGTRKTVHTTNRQHG